MNDETKLYLFTDETSQPYEEGENPFPQTPQMNEIEAKIIKKYGLVIAEDENETDSQNVKTVLAPRQLINKN